MKSLLTLLSTVFLLISCSVMPDHIRKTAIPKVSFPDLIENIDQYRGQTVIQGGYVIDVKNTPDQSVITALQSPLMPGDEPAEKERSRGRLIVETTKFLDPEIFTKGRKFTIAGSLTESSHDAPAKSGESGGAVFPYVKIDAQNIYLWAERKSSRSRYPYEDPFWADDPFWDCYDPWHWRECRFHSPWFRHRHHRRFHRW